MSNTIGLSIQPNTHALADSVHAQRGLVDRIFAFFGIGVTRAQIAELVAQLSNENSSVDQRFESFNELKKLAKPENQDKFNVQLSVDGDNGTWGFQFQVEDLPLASNAQPLSLEMKMDEFATFFEKCYPQDAELLDTLEKANQNSEKKVSLSELPILMASANQKNNIGEKLLAIANNLPGLYCNVEIERDAYAGAFSYTFSVHKELDGNEDAIYSHKFTPSSADSTTFTDLWVSKIKIGVQNAVNYHNATSVVPRAENVIDFVVGGDPRFQEDREKLKAQLDNPAFSSDNFKEMRTHPTDPDRMVAVFNAGELIFDARDPTMSEFRGEALKKQLQQGKYNTLRELIENDMKNTADGNLLGVLQLAKAPFQASEDRMTPEEVGSIQRQVASIAVEATTLGSLWWGISSDSVPSMLEAQFFDNKA